MAYLTPTHTSSYPVILLDPPHHQTDQEDVQRDLREIDPYKFRVISAMFHNTNHP